MSKFVEKSYVSGKEILVFKDNYVAMSAVMDDAGVSANSEGKKIVPKGTFVGGASSSVFVARSEKLKVVSESGGHVTGAAVVDGLLLEDVDVTYGPANCSLLIFGWVKTSALPKPPAEAIVAAMSRNIHIGFIEK